MNISLHKIYCDCERCAMRRSVIDCDGCSAVNILQYHTLTIVGETYTDNAGSRDSDVETIDLCTRCLGKNLQDIFNLWPVPTRAKWIETLKFRKNEK